MKGAPQKFQDFILRYGTHYVKAAKFGGQFKVVKQKEFTGETNVADFRKETQGEFNSIVGSGSAEASTRKKDTSTEVEVQAEGSGGGVSGSRTVLNIKRDFGKKTLKTSR